jgi:CheY-like chemotaxis protein
MTARRFVILCVDDERVSLIVRARVLEKAGYEVIPANSAAEALHALQSRPVDLVLTDLVMPGMNGAELAREIKKQNSSLPVLLFSGVNELPAEASGADLFVSKLEGPDFLCEKVAETLKAASGPAAPS